MLTQAVRTLHFTGRDEVAAELIGTLLKVSEAVSMRYADAAYLLAACEAAESTVLLPLFDRVEAELCKSWTKVPAPEYRDYVARALRFQYCPNFREMLHQAERNEWRSGQHDATTLRSLAIIGGPDAVETLRSLGEARLDMADHVDELGQPWDPLTAVLAVAHDLAPIEEATLLERLALDDPVYNKQWQAVSALAQSGTIPALRSLQRVAAGAASPKLRRYAETRYELVESPAYAALVARELDAATPTDDLWDFLGRLNAAKLVLQRLRDTAAPPGTPSRILSRSLARVWADLTVNGDLRSEAALGLILAKAWPAFEMCLATLPLVDGPYRQIARWLEGLLPALASARAVPLLWALIAKPASPAQRVILIRCLGVAGGVALDDRFERLLAGTSETLAAAAVTALAKSVGSPATARLGQIAATDARDGEKLAAQESLANLGSEQALPYLREKLKDAAPHSQACFQLTGLHHPEAEKLLAEAGRAAQATSAKDQLYLPALAMSGGATAVQAIYDILGPQPNNLALSHVRAVLAPDTATRARDVWNRLANDAAPEWRMTAAAVLVKDSHLALIGKVVRLAIEDESPAVREFARRCLHWDVVAISSSEVANYVVGELEQQVAHSGAPDEFLLELARKCFSGLTVEAMELPAKLAQRSLNVLRWTLARSRPTAGHLVPLLAAFAYPDFSAGAGDVERLLSLVSEAAAQRQILETLIAMQAPNLTGVLIRLSQFRRWPHLWERASQYDADTTDLDILAYSLGSLRHLAYRAAIRRNVRVRRIGLRLTVILANGAISGRTA